MSEPQVDWQALEAGVLRRALKEEACLETYYGAARSAGGVNHTDVARFYRALASLVQMEGGLVVIGEDLGTNLGYVVSELEALAGAHERSG